MRSKREENVWRMRCICMRCSSRHAFLRQRYIKRYAVAVVACCCRCLQLPPARRCFFWWAGRPGERARASQPCQPCLPLHMLSPPAFLLHWRLDGRRGAACCCPASFHSAPAAMPCQPTAMPCCCLLPRHSAFLPAPSPLTTSQPHATPCCLTASSHAFMLQLWSGCLFCLLPACCHVIQARHACS